MSTTAFDTMNELMQGEITAVETYVQALRKVSSSELRHELKRIQSGHVSAAAALRKQIPAETPEPSGGVWDSWERLAQNPRSTRDRAIVEALIEGEESLASAYEDAMRDEAIDFEVKRELDSEHIPRIEDHLEQLEQLLDQPSSVRS